MKALVTGGSGFVASHIIRQLLDDGHHVRATVRDGRNREKLRGLRRLGEQYGEALEVFEADLLVDDSFTHAMHGCDIVFHVASPFKLPEKISDGQREMIDPALHGTENVLRSVNRCESVRRVVLTSSIGAMFGDYSDVSRMAGNTLSEQYFNTTSTASYNPYHYAKVTAELHAWQMAGDSERWDLVAINPGLILGPTLGAPTDSGSLFLIDELVSGKYFYGLPDLAFALVDVRDVAAAHVAAASNPDAHGRYIVAHADMTTFQQIANIVRPIHHRPSVLPRLTIPKPVMKLAGPMFGLSRRYVENHVGVRFTLDNRRSIEELGIEYRPVAKTIQDHYRSWSTQQANKRRTTGA